MNPTGLQDTMLSHRTFGAVIGPISGATPYPWPYDGRVDADRLALVVCGTDWVWATRTRANFAAASRIDQLRAATTARGVTTLLVRHPFPARHRGGRSPVAGSARLEAGAGETAVVAAGVDGFYGSALDAVLRAQGVTHLLVAGFGFEGPVHSTLRRANDSGYECLTVADACVELDPELRAAAVSTIESSGGVLGAVATTETVRRALMFHLFEAGERDQVPVGQC